MTKRDSKHDSKHTDTPPPAIHSHNQSQSSSSSHQYAHRSPFDDDAAAVAEPTSTFSSSTNSLDSETQRRLNPMLDFLKKKRRVRDPNASEDSKALRKKHDIDPVDGKTRACDRTRTFDTFVDGDQLASDSPQKRVGHTWELLRGLAKVKKAFRRSNAQDVEKRERRKWKGKGG